MARFVLVLLLVMVGALVIALFFDHRGRRDARVTRLRSAFLHGRPLAGHSRTVASTVVVHPGGMRFRVPASWTVEMLEHGRPGFAGPPDGDRRIAVEVLSLAGDAPAGPESLVEALKAVTTSGESAVEVLPSGHVLMKTVEAARDEKGPLASYEWRLGRIAPGHGIHIAVFRLRLALDRAADVIAQSDLATMEREVRAATFGEEGSGEAAAT